MQFKIVDPLQYPEWDELVLSNPNYSFFHSSCWAKVLCESYNYTPYYFIIYENNDLVALIPIIEINSYLTGKRGISLPFSDYCEPLFIKENHYNKIMSCLVNYGRKAKWRFIEIRGGINSCKKEDITQSYNVYNYYLHNLDLTQGEEKIYSAIRSSTKRNIKKAIQERVYVNSNSTLTSIIEFYRLNCLTRKMHGLPPQPYKFFKNLYDYVISPGKGLILIAEYKEKVIAGALFLYFGKKIIYKFGASDRIYQSVRANNLIMWEAIKWSLQNGFDLFSFGRTDPDNKGLLQFKNGWGAEMKTVGYYRFNIKHNNKLKKQFKYRNNINLSLKKLPIPLLKIIGKHFYRHIG